VYALLAAAEAFHCQLTDTSEVGTRTELESGNELSNKLMKRAVHLALLATGYKDLTKEGQMGVPDRPWSLYEGVGGMCCTWTAVLTMYKKQNEGCSKNVFVGMPGFNDIPIGDGCV
jgi:hypothetical protein